MKGNKAGAIFESYDAVSRSQVKEGGFSSFAFVKA
jgi:hypothetical protein